MISLKWMKFVSTAKKSAWNTMQTLLTPLAKLEMKITDYSYHKTKERCKSITDDELMKRYAKYIVKDLLKRKNGQDNYEKFIIFNKNVNNYNHYDGFDERILHGLRNINYSCKDKILKNWHYHAEKAKLYYCFNDEEGKEMVAYERKLNELLKEKLNVLGVYAEYENDRKRIEKEKHSKYYVYSKWLDQIGYEKTLVIKIN